MRISSMGYLVKEGARNIWANRLMSLASIGVLMACMLLIGTAVLFSINVNAVVGFVEDQNEVMIYLEDGTEGDRVDEIGNELKKISNITDVTYVSKEDGLQGMIGMDGIVFEGLDETNPLPDSFVVRLDNLTDLQLTTDAIAKIDNVMEVVAPNDVADAVTSIKKVVAVGSVGIVSILAVVSIVILANTIKLTVFNRRKEINIMKYVGATDVFIKLPFVVEGILLGLLSAGIAFFLLWGAYTYLFTYMRQNPSMWVNFVYDNLVPFQPLALEFLAGFAVTGVLIGVAGSLMFVRRYLKV